MPDDEKAVSSIHGYRPGEVPLQKGYVPGDADLVGNRPTPQGGYQPTQGVLIPNAPTPDQGSSGSPAKK